MLNKEEISEEMASVDGSCKRLTEFQKKLNDNEFLSIGDLRIMEHRLDSIPCYHNHYLISCKIDIRKQIKDRLKSFVKYE